LTEELRIISSQRHGTESAGGRLFPRRSRKEIEMRQPQKIWNQKPLLGGAVAGLALDIADDRFSRIEKHGHDARERQSVIGKTASG
jgi:hypothetical protein